MLAIVGSTSLIDCTVNHQFYEQNNFNVIVAGVPFDCFNTPNIAAVNMGLYYSSLGAAQYLVRAGAKSIVAVGANVPGGDHDISGPGAFAEANGVPNNGAFLENVPISDASAIVLRAAQAAGDGGGVVINFTPPEGLKVLQAAEQQGLIDSVMWAWSTPGNDVSVAQALSPAWNGRVGVNAELNLVDSTGPKNMLLQQGPNAAGKSTLVLAVAGVLLPVAGQVFLGEHELTRLPPEKRRQAGVAVVPEGRRLMPDLTVAENLQVATYSLSRHDAASSVDHAVELFPELKARWTIQGRYLSGGEQQMVVLAQAIVSRPTTLLVDELSLGLAPVVVKRLVPVLGAIARSGVGVLLIEQFAHVVLGLANTAYILEGGRIRYHGTASELRQKPELLHSAYLLRTEAGRA